jgi:gliding motility-associated-like protein
MKRYLLVGLIVSVLGVSSRAQQISTTSNAPYNSVPYLVNNVLMGQGMTAYNISSYGASIQRGFFSNGGTAIGIDSGLVMCSGNVTNIMTSTGATASTAIANGAGQGAGDADLLSVAQSVPSLIGQSFNVYSTWDACIINFDFVPSGDTVEFNYVFGSDEYTTWINTSYNDVFGFFLSGPGINGSYSNSAVNVATVPNTSPALPISISTIHPNLNGTYYNTGGSLLAYNGYTDVMTAILAVQACDTFHMKLGVADGSDKILDTGVFLEAGSFQATGLVVSPAPSYNPFGADTALYEGCGDVKIYFTRNDSVLPAANLAYEVWGAAQMGVDYSNIINSAGNPCYFNTTTQHWECEVTFLAGEETDSISFTVFYDNLNEGVEDLVIAIVDSIQLGCHTGDTIELSVIDQPDLTINAFGDITLDCNDSAALIGVNVSNGLPPFNYAWSNGPQDSSQYVSPTITTAYVVTVTDACGQQEETDFVNVSVFNVPWSSTKWGDNQTISCIDPPVTMGVSVVFNDGIWHGDISYQWSTGSTDSTISVFSVTNETYTVTITRGCTGETVTHTFHLYTENDPVVLSTNDIPETYFDCPGDTVTIKVSTQGGYPPYTFSWSNGATDSTTLVGPLVTTVYTVTVHDVCALVDYVEQVTVEMPVADPLEIHGVVNDTVPCKNVKVHFGDAVPRGGFGWGYTFSWDNFETEATYIQDIMLEDVQEYTIWLTDGCRTDTITKTVYGIVAEKNDLDLLVHNDTLICYGDVIELTAEAIYGAPDYEYKWSNGAKTPNTLVSPKVPTTYEVRMTDFCDTVRRASIFVDVSQIIPDFDWEYLNDYEVEFTNKSVGTSELVGFIWNIEEPGLISYEESPIIRMPDGKQYMAELTVVDEYGCKAVDSSYIKPTFQLFIPTGFSPNNDGINDYWTISSVGIREMLLEIYDRWGNSIFTTTDKHFRWDGTLNGERLPMGSYTYRIVFYTDDNDYIERRGTFNLLNDFQSRN